MRRKEKVNMLHVPVLLASAIDNVRVRFSGSKSEADVADILQMLHALAETWESCSRNEPSIFRSICWPECSLTCGSSSGELICSCTRRILDFQALSHAGDTS